MAAFVSSYIPTTTAAATRAADVVSITGTAFSSWYRQDEGTVHTAWQFSGRNSSAQQTVCSINNGGGDQLIPAFASVFNTLSSSTFVASINQGRLDISGTPTVLIPYRSATAYNASGRSFTVNGLAPASGTGSLPTTTQLEIGSGGGGGYINGTIRRLVFWPQALPSRLQSITQ